MALSTLPNIICSLTSLGSIFNLDYSFKPQEGVRISLFFVNQTGIYIPPALGIQQKTLIQIGTATFMMYPVKYEIQYSSGRRVAKVDFVDDTFKLKKYWVSLTGSGCGFRVYQLGKPVDPRTLAQQVQQAIDPVAQQIANFTQFSDIEYGFQDFLNLLSQVGFNVQITAAFDPTPTKYYIGTFLEVLNDWCNFYNLTYFFENSILKIFDPTTILINFPDPAALAALYYINEYNVSETIEDTYGKTVFYYFQQEGGQFQLNESSSFQNGSTDGQGPLLIQTSSLYPAGLSTNQSLTAASDITNAFNQIESDISNSFNQAVGDIAAINTSSQSDLDSFMNQTQTDLSNNNSNINVKIGTLTNTPITDINQVLASLFGQEFWFIYNFVLGSANSECGWTPIQLSQIADSTEALALAANINSFGQPTNVAIVNQDVFQQKYQAYSEYGQRIAGRYYLSDERSSLLIDETFQWFNVSDGQIFDYTTSQALSQKVNIQFLPQNQNTNGPSVIKDTVINQYFNGIQYLGDRMIYFDNEFPSFIDNFKLSDNTNSLITQTFDQLFNGLEGSKSADFSGLGSQKYVGYFNIEIPQDILTIINNITTYAQYIQPRYGTLNLSAVKSADLQNLLAAKQQSNQPLIVNSTVGPIVNSNTAIIKAIQNGSYYAYYNKYNTCASAFSDVAEQNFQRIFESKAISIDIPMNISFAKNSGNSYTITRDLTYLQAILNSNLLQQLATPRNFTTKNVSFKTNIFIDPTINYLTNGYTNISINFTQDGIEASYVISNEVLRLPVSLFSIEKLEARIKNSWIRGYNPPQTIS